MEALIKFRCRECSEQNKKTFWSNAVDAEWESLRAAFEHMVKNPDHYIDASVELPELGYRQ